MNTCSGSSPETAPSPVAVGPIVSGHQPNFFPWFGYFEKMAKADIFVFSDDVQYTKQSYVNRVELLLGSKSGHLTLPVQKGNDQRIADKLYVRDEATLRKIQKTLTLNLAGLPNFFEIAPVIAEFEKAYLNCVTVADLNIHMISHIASLLGIGTPTYRGTALGLDAFKSNERLIRRCRLFRSEIYLCGRGADDYQDEELFKSEHIELRKVSYAIGQAAIGEDIKYSVLHAIAKCGIAPLRKTLADYHLESCRK
ncbi:MAG: WbqC family protein [Acidovorax sp.]|nr:WbqC family protein [Acidovorax sp.]